MKKVLVIGVMFFSFVVFGQNLSELYKEFIRRDSIVFNRNEVKVMRFLTDLDAEFDLNSINAIEFPDTTNPSKFLIQTQNKDLCIGDIDGRLLRCKNALGITSIQFDGDSD